MITSDISSVSALWCLKYQSTSVQDMEIHLDTPPASPMLLTLDDLPSPEPNHPKAGAVSYTVISPEKKPWKPSAPMRKRRRALTPSPEDDGAEPEVTNLSPLDPTSPFPSMGNIPGNMSSTVDLLGHATLTHIPSFAARFDGKELDDYYVYVESVMTFATGVFQVSDVVFVVQGWDKRGESAMVWYLIVFKSFCSRLGG